MVKEMEVYCIDPAKVFTMIGLVNTAEGNGAVAQACERTLKMFRANEDTDFADLARVYADCLVELYSRKQK